MSNSLHSLLQFARSELVQSERTHSVESTNTDISWLLLYGIRELRLWDKVNSEVLEFINHPIPQSEGDKKPLSRLMVLSYERYFGIKIGERISEEAFREKVQTWFVNTGMAYFGLEPLLADNPLELVNARERHHFSSDIMHIPGANLVGYAHSSSGLGEQLRSVARCLESHGIPYTISNIPHRGDKLDIDSGLNPVCVDCFRYPITIFFLNTVELQRYWIEHGDKPFNTGYSIGLFPWELPAVPEQAIHASALVDEIWAISRFNMKSYKESGHPNVLHMRPLLNPCLPEQTHISRALKPFRFLNIFDAQSYVSRKNIMAVVSAFTLAFPPSRNSNVQLQIKITNANWQNELLITLLHYCRLDRRILVIDQNMSTEDLHKLYSACDCYISLHRSEGFGYTIAEAMLHGKPVVATNWSGSTDLLDADRGLPVRYKLIDVPKDAYPFYHGQKWAEPDIAHAADCMKEVRDMSREDRNILGSKARQFVYEQHVGRNAQKAYINRIEQIYKSI